MLKLLTRGRGYTGHPYVSILVSSSRIISVIVFGRRHLLRCICKNVWIVLLFLPSCAMYTSNYRLSFYELKKIRWRNLHGEDSQTAYPKIPWKILCLGININEAESRVMEEDIVDFLHPIVLAFLPPGSPSEVVQWRGVWKQIAVPTKWITIIDFLQLFLLTTLPSVCSCLPSLYNFSRRYTHVSVEPTHMHADIFHRIKIAKPLAFLFFFLVVKTIQKRPLYAQRNTFKQFVLITWWAPFLDVWWKKKGKNHIKNCLLYNSTNKFFLMDQHTCDVIRSSQNNPMSFDVLKHMDFPSIQDVEYIDSWLLCIQPPISDRTRSNDNPLKLIRSFPYLHRETSD